MAAGGTVALPFCDLQFTAPIPPPGYPENLVTLGEHLRKTRLDRGMTQREVASCVSATDETVRNWELGRTEPEARHVPPILDFLGYDPRPVGQNLGERVRREREGVGLTQRELAAQIGVDPRTVWRVEKGHVPRSRWVRDAFTAFAETALSGCARQSGGRR